MTEAASRHIMAPPSERHLIRIDMVQDKFGVSAALRRAFAADANDASEHDLERLLNDLH